MSRSVLPHWSPLSTCLFACLFALSISACDGQREETAKSASLLFGMPSLTTHDDFDGTTLADGWTPWDGYAVATPGDAANHATFGVSDAQLRIGFPPGAEHNQW